MVVFLALLAALISGTADYTGGRATTRHPALTVNLYAQLVAATILPICAWLIGWQHLRGSDFVLGFVGGVCAGTGYLIFFHALARGRMSVVAPLAALTTALVPVTFDIFNGVSLPAGRWAGVGVALIAIPALAFRRDSHGGSLSLRQEFAYAIAAGFGFAGFFVTIGYTSTDSGQWPAAFAALGATTTMGVLCVDRGERLGPPPRLALLTGVLLVGSGLAINHALQVGPLAVVTVLGSLYPLATSALAYRFDGEPIGRINVVGILAAIGGASLIAIYR